MPKQYRKIEVKVGSGASDDAKKNNFRFWSVKTWPRWGKVLGGIIAAILILAIGVVLRYVFAYNGFLNKITDWGKEKKEYSVVIMSKGGENNNDRDSDDKNDESALQALSGKNVGFLKTDSQATVAEKYLQGKIQFEAGMYDDVDTLIMALDGGLTEGIVLESSRLETLRESSENTQNSATEVQQNIKNTKDLTKNLQVIYTFEIEVEIEPAEVTNKEITTEPFVVYISGTDSRAGVKAAARSDVNILAVVNPAKGKILLVSIPRDMYVQLHGTTGLKDKLTHAGIYGIDMSKATIEDFLGVKIDHTIKVSFDTVVKTVDQLDGIEINSDQEMRLKVEGKDKYCDFIVGKQMVDGDCALRFARERKSYETGDRHRGENQQQVITSIIGRLSQSKNYLLRVPTILDIAADSFETDFNREQISAFLRMQLGQKINWQVESISVDGTGDYAPTYSMGANLPLYVMVPSVETVNNASNKINEYL